MKFSLCFFVFWTVPWLLPAAVIGMNPPSQRLTADRIEELPPEQQAAWEKYLKNSTRELRTDKYLLSVEIKQHGVGSYQTPAAAKAVEGISLKETPAWYGQPEGRRLADIIVSFQTPAGGWGKNVNLTSRPRVPGELFSSDFESHGTGREDDLLHPLNAKFVGTFDNNATTTQLRFLAKVITATATSDNSSYRSNFLRGLNYIFEAQYPNGGWPQVWPLEGNYHDAITYNDNAMTRVLELLRDVAAGQGEFAFVPPEIRTRAAASLNHGIGCVLATQIRVEGHRTVWCQQHDMLTLRAASARTFEMPAQASSESAKIMMFLMQLPHPDSNVVAAVHEAAVWFQKTQIRDKAYRDTGTNGFELVSAPGAGPIWARYYEIGSDRPIFGDRDRSLHDAVAEISRERREGYSWFDDMPQRALENYVLWTKDHPPF